MCVILLGVEKHDSKKANKQAYLVNSKIIDFNKEGLMNMSFISK